MKEKTWLDQNLSEFVDNTLKHGLIPIFRFLDKDKIETHEAAPEPPIDKRTPIDVLERELKFIRRMHDKFKNREGITIPEDRKEEVEKNLSECCNNLLIRELEFEKAIQLLKSNQP